jgi:hypothetical protein
MSWPNKLFFSQLDRIQVLALLLVYLHNAVFLVVCQKYPTKYQLWFFQLGNLLDYIKISSDIVN